MSAVGGVYMLAGTAYTLLAGGAALVVVALLMASGPRNAQ